MDGFSRSPSERFRVGFGIPPFRIEVAQSPMGAVGVQGVFCRENQLSAVWSRQLKFPRNAHGLIRGRIRA